MMDYRLQSAFVEYFLSLPGIDNTDSIRALVFSSGIDNELRNQLKFDQSPMDFFRNYIPLALSYQTNKDGRNGIESLLIASREMKGKEGKETCDRLLKNLHEYIKQQELYQESELKFGHMIEQYNNEVDIFKKQHIEELVLDADQKFRQQSHEACALSVIHTSIIKRGEYPIISVTLENKGIERKFINKCYVIFLLLIVCVEMP